MMLIKLIDWIAGREPVGAATGIAAVVTAGLGVAAAFGAPVTETQIAALGALAAALAGWAARRVVSPVMTPEERRVDRMITSTAPADDGQLGILVGILVVLVLAMVGLFAICTDDEEALRMQLISVTTPAYHEDGPCNPEYEGCDEDEGGRKDKRTCLFGCDNIIIVPGLPGQEQPPPPEERAALIPPTPDKIIGGIQTMADAGINLGTTIARLVVDYVVTVFRFIV